jgi:CheY-like chemotaxis protein
VEATSTSINRNISALPTEFLTKKPPARCQPSGPIDILLTDVVMPELRGSELARQVQDLHPNIHVMYTSGYAEGGMDQSHPA